MLLLPPRDEVALGHVAELAVFFRHALHVGDRTSTLWSLWWCKASLSFINPRRTSPRSGLVSKEIRWVTKDLAAAL
jgi:hypothetical protein